MKFRVQLAQWFQRRCLKILTDDGVIGILIAHLGTFRSELKTRGPEGSMALT